MSIRRLIRNGVFFALASMLVHSIGFAQEADADRESDRKELLALNEELARSQIVDRDPEFPSRVALDEFRVVESEGNCG